jgi:hypothetical protein
MLTLPWHLILYSLLSRIHVALHSTRYMCLAHLSWKLVSYSDRPVVYYPSVCKLLGFRLLQKHWANFNQTWHRSSLGRIQICSNEGGCPSPKEVKSERAKIYWNCLKTFSRISKPNSIKFSTNYSWIKGIQVCSNEGECPSPRGDNSKRVKVHWQFLKIFPRTSWPNSIKLCTNYPLLKGIQACSNKGPSRSKGR